MRLSENLSAYRRKLGLTQEELAERLGVSRQAVSKWESNRSRPELELLLAMAELYGCTVDDLLRGAPPETSGQPEEEADPEEEQALFEAYDREQRTFAMRMAGGVGLTLLGIALGNFFSRWEGLEALFFFLPMAAAVYLFITGGMRYDAFRKEHPPIPDLYEPEEQAEFRRTFTTGMAVAVALVLADLALAGFLDGTAWLDENVGIGLFFLILSGAVTILVALGILYGRYNVAEYNRTTEKERAKNAAKDSRQSRPQKEDEDSEEEPGGRSGAIIMLTATGVFLVAGFVFHAWHPAWIVFPLGGILCGIVEAAKKK